MKDITLKFKDRNQCKSFLESINWFDEDAVQDSVMIDEVGFTYKVASTDQEVNDIVEKNDGYFLNVRITNDDALTGVLTQNEFIHNENMARWA